MMKQRSPDWLEMRKTHIGGSDVSCIMGNNPWKSAYTLWLEKTGRKEADKTNAAMQHGIDMEPIAIKEYIEEYGFVKSELESLFYQDWDVAMASLDAISLDGKLIVEVKNPFRDKTYNLAVDNIVPKYYVDQIQWCLGISGAEKCHYFVRMDEWTNTKVDVFADKAYFLKMIEEAKTFWEQVLADKWEGETPAEANHIEDKETNLKALELKKIKLEKKALESKEKELESELKELLGKTKCYLPMANMRYNVITKKGTVKWQILCKDFEIEKDTQEKYRSESTTYIKFELLDKD